MITTQMGRQVPRGSAGDYQADEQAGVARLSWPQSSRRAGRCHAAHLAIIKKMSRQVSRGSVFVYQAVSRQVSCGSAGDYQADEQAGVARLSCQLSSR